VKVDEEDTSICLCGKVFIRGGDEVPHMITQTTYGWKCVDSR